MKTCAYQPRSYRARCRRRDLVSFHVMLAESDLLVMAEKELVEETRAVLGDLRSRIEHYIEVDREFLTALTPVRVPADAPGIVKDMTAAGAVFGVGPMAAVAGAISEYVARHLAEYSGEVIVENGGDDFVISNRPVTAAIYAGNSPLSMKLGVEIGASPEGIGICTSSGTVGHSLSFGSADAVTVIACSGCIADAAATAIGNRVKTEADIGEAIAYARSFATILGVVIIKDESVGICGEIVKLRRI